MKVKVISRNPDVYLRDTKKELHREQRNYDPDQHPLESAREYVRALNATKLERVFAKPFVGNLSGHKDGISSFCKHPLELSSLTSGSYDGEIFVWDLLNREYNRSFMAHDGYVRGITYTPNGEQFISVGDDKQIKTWNSKAPEIGESEEPINTIMCRTVLTGISHHQKEPLFATCGEVCYLWEESRNEPIKAFKWGVDTLHHVAFNPIETALLAACASDRSIIFYDKREKKPLRKMVMNLRPNALSWNPMEAYHFTVASEDYNLYTFDSRNLSAPLQLHGGHVSAVTDVDYAPTGKEFVSSSYDKTIRIYSVDKKNSRDVYHTKRMQHVTKIGWSLDNKFIYCGSDEMNIRLWKANASEKLGPLRPREKNAMHYNAALKEKFATHPQIRKISNHRQVPKHIYNNQKKFEIMKDKVKRKEYNRIKHSKPGTITETMELDNKVLKEE